MRRIFLTAVSWLALSIALGITSPIALAQRGCGNGSLVTPTGVNGKITICLPSDPKLAELEKQLDDVQQTLSANPAQSRELARAVRGVNAVGRNVQPDQQAALLQSLYKRLRDLATSDQKQTENKLADLADKIDNLNDQITAQKEDQKTSQQTIAALHGQLGEAIAALDLNKAQQQLDSIQAKLDQIGQDTHDIKQTLQEQNAREQAAADEAKKKEDELDKDPNMYTRAQIMPSISPLNGQVRLMIYFYTRPPLYPPFIDSSFSIAFRKGTSAAWRIDPTNKQVSATGELWLTNLTPDEIGDKATLCFVAHDKPSGRLREWTQSYDVSPSTIPSQAYNFVPVGDASMKLTDGEACDGATQVRAEAPPATAVTPPATQSANDQILQQQAKIQQRIAELQQRAGEARLETFATIRAEGTRRGDRNGGQWQIKVDTQPFRSGTTFYDANVQANLVDTSGQFIPLQLSNRQLFVNIESRFASVNRMGVKAVVCLTATSQTDGKPHRLTQWFSIETSSVSWTDGGRQVPGDKATFIPSQPPTLTEPSDARCQ